MADQYKVACVFGGTGFLGTQVVRELAKAGYTVKVATRVPERAYELKTCGTVGQIVPFACSYDEAGIAEAIKGTECVVNLVGILFEKGKSTFKRAHVEIPSLIAQACAREGVKRLVHVSALGIEQSRAHYAETKLEGEVAVFDAFPKATVLRPSVVFGPGDDFFNMFAGMAQFLPFLPLIGGGRTRFQPVFVGDVADAVMKCLSLPTLDENTPQGKIYELGGPEIVTMKEVYERLFAETHVKRGLVPMPFAIAKVKGFMFSATSRVIGGVTGLTPKPLLTADQVESLKTDSVVAADSYGLEDLGIQPQAMAIILPTYLSRYRPGGRFGDRKSA